MEEVRKEYRKLPQKEEQKAKDQRVKYEQIDYLTTVPTETQAQTQKTEQTEQKSKISDSNQIDLTDKKYKDCRKSVNLPKLNPIPWRQPPIYKAVFLKHYEIEKMQLLIIMFQIEYDNEFNNKTDPNHATPLQRRYVLNIYQLHDNANEEKDLTQLNIELKYKEEYIIYTAYLKAAEKELIKDVILYFKNSYVLLVVDLWLRHDFSIIQFPESKFPENEVELASKNEKAPSQRSWVKMAKRMKWFESFTLEQQKMKDEKKVNLKDFIARETKRKLAILQSIGKQKVRYVPAHLIEHKNKTCLVFWSINYSKYTESTQSQEENKKGRQTQVWDVSFLLENFNELQKTSRFREHWTLNLEDNLEETKDPPSPDSMNDFKYYFDGFYSGLYLYFKLGRFEVTCMRSMDFAEHSQLYCFQLPEAPRIKDKSSDPEQTSKPEEKLQSNEYCIRVYPKDKPKKIDKILGSICVDNEIVTLLKNKKLLRFSPRDHQKIGEPISYESNLPYRYLTVSRDKRLVLATTNKETRKSFGFALFDAESYEPVLSDESGTQYSEFIMTSDFIAYQLVTQQDYTTTRVFFDFKPQDEDKKNTVTIVDLVEGFNTTSAKYTQLKTSNCIKFSYSEKNQKSSKTQFNVFRPYFELKDHTTITTRTIIATAEPKNRIVIEIEQTPAECVWTDLRSGRVLHRVQFTSKDNYKTHQCMNFAVKWKKEKETEQLQLCWIQARNDTPKSNKKMTTYQDAQLIICIFLDKELKNPKEIRYDFFEDFGIAKTKTKKKNEDGSEKKVIGKFLLKYEELKNLEPIPISGVLMKNDFEKGLYIYNNQEKIFWEISIEKHYGILPYVSYNDDCHNVDIKKLEIKEGIEQPLKRQKDTYKNVECKHLFKNGFYFNIQNGALEHIKARIDKNHTNRLRRVFHAEDFKFDQQKFWEHVTDEPEGKGMLIDQRATPFSSLKSVGKWEIDEMKKKEYFSQKKFDSFPLSKNCLATEKFGKIIKEDDTGDYIIYEGDIKARTWLINDDLAHDAKMLWVGDDQVNPKYVAIEMNKIKQTGKNRWAIVRLAGGTRICELEDVSLVEEEHPMHNWNVHRKAVCMIDNRTLKCYDLTEDNLLHLGKISTYLNKADIQKDTDQNESSPIKILGLPAPSCFPSKFAQFAREPTTFEQKYEIDGGLLFDKQQEIVNRYLCKFLLKCYHKDFEHMVYENILHYICKHDLEKALSAYQLTNNFTFCRTPISPMHSIQMLTGEKLINHLDKSNFHLRDRTRIVKEISAEEFKSIMKLSDKTLKVFFDICNQQLRYFPKHNPFKVLTGQLKPFPYLPIPEIGSLKDKEGTEEAKKMKNALIMPIKKKEDKEKLKPIQINVMLLPLNFTPGSASSLEYLQELKKKDISTLYDSEVAQSVVDFKMHKVKGFGYAKLILYCLFLLNINVYAEKWLMVFWAFYFTSIELIQIINNGGLTGFVDFWNVLDFFRIALIIEFIIQEQRENAEVSLEKYVILTVLSWFGLMHQLCIFQQFQFIMTLIINSIYKMVSFIVVLAIMFNAFSLGYYYMINGTERYSEDWVENLTESYLLQFVMIFGSFGDYQMESVLQMILFMLTAFTMPLLMMNLLIAILGETYNVVNEKWAQNKYYQRVNIIYDLELLMFWNKKKGNNKMHLLYAQSIKDKDDVNFISLNKHVDDKHKTFETGAKQHYTIVNKKIEKCKDEIKQTMRIHAKSQKEQLEDVKKIVKKFENKKNVAQTTINPEEKGQDGLWQGNQKEVSQKSNIEVGYKADFNKKKTPELKE